MNPSDPLRHRPFPGSNAEERRWFVCSVCEKKKVVMRPLVDDPTEITDFCLAKHDLCGMEYEICWECYNRGRTLIPCPHCAEAATPEMPNDDVPTLTDLLRPDGDSGNSHEGD